MADWYFIDGQALEPTSFGRENANGVWVPREVDFNDPTPEQPRWSDWLTATVGTIDSGAGSAPAFNGDLSDGPGRVFTSGGGQLTWAPTVDATFTTTLEIFNTNTAAQQNITWNGNTVNPTGGWVTVFTDATPDANNPNVINAAQPLVITGNGGGNRAELYAVRLDGEIVLDPFMWSGMLFAADSQAAPPFNTTDVEFNAAGPATPPSQAFNGNNGNYAGSTNPGSWIVFRPREAITVNNQIRFQSNFGLSEVWVNETQQAITLNQELVEINFNGDLENLAIRGNPASFAGTLIFLQIDGQTLINGQNNLYGPNGFHLDFSDPDNLGEDSSGNQNNFTPNNFNTDAVGSFTPFLTASGGFNANFPAENCFRAGVPPADPNNFCSDNGTGTITFAPTTAINVRNTLEVYNWCGRAVYNFGPNVVNREINSQGTWNMVYNAANDGGATTLSNNQALTVDMGNPQTGNTAIAGIRVDGRVLLDNMGEDFDSMQDSPTENYATGNPLHIAPLEIFFLLLPTWATTNHQVVSLVDCNPQYHGMLMSIGISKSK